MPPLNPVLRIYPRVDSPAHREARCCVPRLCQIQRSETSATFGGAREMFGSARTACT